MNQYPMPVPMYPPMAAPPPPPMAFHEQYYPSYFFDYLVVIDFEATCELSNSDDYEHEIIQFPAILVDLARQQVVDEFNYYCKPSKNSKLSEFCTKLTGITQDTVDNAPEFPKALRLFNKWLKYHGLGTSYTFAIVADGFCDMGKFLYTQCLISKIDYPQYAHQWINIRHIYSSMFNMKWYKLATSLEFIGEKFTGVAHNGLDDARNITKIVLCLLRLGSNPIPNEKIVLSEEAQLKNPAKFRYALRTVKTLRPDEFYKTYFTYHQRPTAGNGATQKKKLFTPPSRDNKENISTSDELKTAKPKSRRKSKSNRKPNRLQKKTELVPQVQGEVS